MEGKAKAEQDSLTQAEEEDTSPLCRPTAQIAAVSACADKALVHWASEKIIKGGARSAELIPKTKKLRDRTRIGSN